MKQGGKPPLDIRLCSLYRYKLGGNWQASGVLFTAHGSHPSPGEVQFHLSPVQKSLAHPSWNVGHSTFSKPDAHMMLLAGSGQQNGTVPRSWLFFVLRHFIWQELMRRAPPNRYAPCYGDKIGRCLLSNEHQRDE